MHGGTTEEILVQKVNEAMELARENRRRCQELAKKLDTSQVWFILVDISETVYYVLY